MKELSVEDQIYLCKYHDVDTDLYTNLGLKENEVEPMLDKLKANGMYDQYRQMPDEEYEKVIKREKKKSKAEKILDKYNFDKSKIYYERLKRTLMICENIKNTEELNLNSLYVKVADELKIESPLVANNCRTALEDTYIRNNDVFRNAGYYKKPTFKDFVIREFGLKNDIQEAKENIYEVKERGNQELPKQTITVPIKMIYEYWYLKGYADGTEGNQLRKFNKV